jgi:hypothetical protein
MVHREAYAADESKPKYTPVHHIKEGNFEGRMCICRVVESLVLGCGEMEGNVVGRVHEGSTSSGEGSMYNFSLSNCSPNVASASAFK